MRQEQDVPMKTRWTFQRQEELRDCMDWNCLLKEPSQEVPEVLHRPLAKVACQSSRHHGTRNRTQSGHAPRS